MLSNGSFMLIRVSCNIFYVHFAAQNLQQNVFVFFTYDNLVWKKNTIRGLLSVNCPKPGYIA